MELVRAAALTGYFAVAARARLNVMPLLGEAGSVAGDDEQSRADASGAFGRSLARGQRGASGCMTFGYGWRSAGELSDIGLVSLADRPPADASGRLGSSAEYRNRINSTLTLQLEES